MSISSKLRPFPLGLLVKIPDNNDVNILRKLLIITLSSALFLTNTFAGGLCCFPKLKIEKQLNTQKMAMADCPHHQGQKSPKKQTTTDEKENKEQNKEQNDPQCRAVCCELIAKLPLKVTAPSSPLKAISAVEFFFTLSKPKNFNITLRKPPKLFS